MGALGLLEITITRTIKSSWHSASRKEDGSYEIDAVKPEVPAKGLGALIPWRAARPENLLANPNYATG